MKQHIAAEQLGELTADEYMKLVCMIPKTEYSDLLSLTLNLNIGTMIEILINNAPVEESEAYPSLDIGIYFAYECGTNDRHCDVSLYWEGRREEKELCDVLWENIKRLLKEE